MDQAASSGVADPSPIFKQAVDRFTASLTEKQKKSFQACTLDDVRQAALKLQNQQEAPKKLRNMNRIQGFLEGMDEYRKVIEAFLNCTPFLGYAWVTDTWVKSQDIILDAYVDIGERLLAFTKYRSLFEDRPDMRRVLELYYCDIIEFHYHATAFLNRPGWKKFFSSLWKTFDARFKQILASMGRNKELIESHKGTLAILEIQKTHESVKENFQGTLRLERKKELMIVTEKLNATDVLKDHLAASDQRAESASGHWISRNPLFCGWESGSSGKARLFISGIPGAGKTILASYIIEYLQRKEDSNVVYFYCKADESEKTRFEDILRSITSQIAQKDVTLGLYLYEKLAPVSALSLTAILKGITTESIKSQEKLFIVIDGLDEMADNEAEKSLDWLQEIEGQECKLVCLGQRTDLLLRKMTSAEHLQLECTKHNADIEAYVGRQMNQLVQDFELTAQVAESIEKRIISNAQGMFLYAKLVMENLLNQTSLNNLNDELKPETFPIDWRAAYGRIVSNIFKSGPQRAAAVQIIKWVACAVRPLKWREIQATFFIDPVSGTADYNGGGGEEPGYEHELQLVHSTAREYLVNQNLLDCVAQHANIASFCIDYLLSAPFRSTSLRPELEKYTRTGYYAFQDYAVAHSIDHIAMVTGSQNDDTRCLAQKLPSFFTEYDIPGRHEYIVSYSEHGRLSDALRSVPSNTRSRNLWSEMERRNARIRAVLAEYSQSDDDADAPERQLVDMYGALQFKCPKIGCHRFSKPFHESTDRDRHVRKHERPFMCTDDTCPYQSLGFESEERLADHVAQYHGVLGDAIAFPQPRPKVDTLTKACRRGDLLAVKKLMANGADIMSRDSLHGRLPLTTAIAYDHLEVFNYLLKIAGALTQSYSDKDQQDICFYLLQQDHPEDLENLVQVSPEILLNWELGVNKVSQRLLVLQQLPLRCLRYQLDKGWFDRKSLEGLLATAILARLNDHSHLLLSNLESFPSAVWILNDEAVLLTAIRVGMIKVAERMINLTTEYLKIDQEVLINCIDQCYTELVRVLLDSGKLDPYILRYNYDYIFDRAREQGHLEIMEMLHSAHQEVILTWDNVSEKSEERLQNQRECFSAASSNDVEALEVLLKQHPDLLADFDGGGSPLLAIAVKKRSFNLFRMLLRYPGIDLNACDTQQRTSLLIACETGYSEFLEVLLDDHRTWLSVVDMDGRSAYWLAAARNRLQIVNQLLRKESCDLQTCDRFGISVTMAAIVGFEDINRFCSVKSPEVIVKNRGFAKCYERRKTLIETCLRERRINTMSVSLVDILEARTELERNRTEWFDELDYMNDDITSLVKGSSKYGDTHFVPYKTPSGEYRLGTLTHPPESGSQERISNETDSSVTTEQD